MAKFKASVIKQSKRKMQKSQELAAPGDIVNEINFVDDGEGNYTVEGVSAAGNPSDISGVAKLAVTSADETRIVVDPAVNGMTFGLKAVGPITQDPVNIAVSATWNDGSQSYIFNIPAKVRAGDAVGIRVIELGPPVLA